MSAALAIHTAVLVVKTHPYVDPLCLLSGTAAASACHTADNYDGAGSHNTAPMFDWKAELSCKPVIVKEWYPIETASPTMTCICSEQILAYRQSCCAHTWLTLSWTASALKQVTHVELLMADGLYVGGSGSLHEPQPDQCGAHI